MSAQLRSESGGRDPDERGSVRPSIPPLTWATLAVLVGVRLGEWAGRSGHVCAWWFVALFGLALGCGVAVARSNKRSASGARAGRSPFAIVLVIAAAVACGAAVGAISWRSFDESVAVLSQRSPGEWCLSVVEDGRDSWFGVLVQARVESGPGAGATVTVMLPDSAEEAPLRGDTLSVRGAFQTTSPEYAVMERQQRVAGTVRAWTAKSSGVAGGVSGRLVSVRRWLLGKLERVEGDGGALLAAMLAGYKGRVAGTRVEDDFRAAGLSHVLAVSGTHLAVVAWASGAVAGLLGAHRRARWMVVLVAALLFTLFTGVHASTVRAAVMVAATCAAALSGRRHDALGALSATVLGMVLLQPELAFSVGLALSASAVAGLVVFSPLAEEWIRVALPLAGRRVASAVSVAVVAQTVTTPLVASTFETVATLGPLANIVCVPLVTLSLWLGCVGTVLCPVSDAIGVASLRLAGSVLDVCAWVARQVASVPGAVVSTTAVAPALSLAVCCGLALAWVRWPRPSRPRAVRAALAIVTCLAVLPVISPRGSVQARLVVLDVGQGDAILVQDGSACLLVDTGEDPEVLRAALGRVHVRHIDAVILTHAHEDHTGGLAGLQGTCSVGRILVPEATLKEFAPLAEEAASLTTARTAADALQGLGTGDILEVGEFRIEVLWPAADTTSENTNDGSVVLHVTSRDFSALLTGDAEEAVYQQLAEEGRLPQVDVLKVPHHGSAEGVGRATLEAMRPRVAIVSVGQDNDFGHPDPGTVRLLQDAECVVWRTDISGDVFVDALSGGFEVQPMSEGVGSP